MLLDHGAGQYDALLDTGAGADLGIRTDAHVRADNRRWIHLGAGVDEDVADNLGPVLAQSGGVALLEQAEVMSVGVEDSPAEYGK